MPSGLRAAARSGQLTKDQLKDLYLYIKANPKLDRVDKKEAEKIYKNPKSFFNKIVPTVETKTKSEVKKTKSK